MRLLKEQIKGFGDDTEVAEVGRVLSVGDGIASGYSMSFDGGDGQMGTHDNYIELMSHSIFDLSTSYAFTSWIKVAEDHNTNWGRR